MEKYYRIEFTAILQKMSLAFKMECEIEVFWKRGQKIAQTGKVPFRNCTAQFNQALTISCNMKLDVPAKKFKEKETKFTIVIYTDKGNKQAGQVLFDVAPFMNQRCKEKQYQMKLNKCPDKNAKIAFNLKASIIEEKAFDSISQSSLVSVDVQNLTSNIHQNGLQINNIKLPEKDCNIQNEPKIGSSTSIMVKKKQPANSQTVIVPTTDRIDQNVNVHRSQQENKALNHLKKAATQRQKNVQKKIFQKIKQLEKQNSQIKQKLKKKQGLEKENIELKRKLRDDQYESCKEIKKKLEAGKKEIESLQKHLRGEKKLKQEIKRIQASILKTKQQIMSIFNEADQYGPEALDLIQQACGLKQY